MRITPAQASTKVLPWLVVLLVLAPALHAQISARYPNELPDYRFAENAPWRELIPLRSGFAEVRKALGKPVREVDLANYSKPYPGDAKAVQPLLEYEFGRDWTLYVYFVFPSNDKLPGGFAGKVRSFELVPKNPIRFPKPSADIFRRSEVIAADAGWNDFADGSGLRYEIYRSRIPSGRRKADDLNRIVYGPSDAELARWKKE